MTWSRAIRTWPSGALPSYVVFEGKIDKKTVAEIREPAEESYLGYWHYNCKRCSDNLASQDVAHLKKYARDHQVEKHKES